MLYVNQAPQFIETSLGFLFSWIQDLKKSLTLSLPLATWDINLKSDYVTKIPCVYCSLHIISLTELDLGWYGGLYYACTRKLHLFFGSEVNLQTDWGEITLRDRIKFLIICCISFTL